MNCIFKSFWKKDEFNEAESALELQIQTVSNFLLHKQQDLRIFSLDELRKATENFHESNLIGTGGYSNVFKGTLKLGHGGGLPTLVAISRSKQTSPQADKVWAAEISVLRSTNHRNLVKLLGYCLFDGKKKTFSSKKRTPEVHRFLVYEYMPNKDLHDHLLDTSLPALSWITRLQIMLGAAQGLGYLHEGLDVPIIHRDFNPTNVLLDEDFRVKLSGFHHAREAPTGDESHSHVSTEVAGTLGYLDPHYYVTGHLSLKSDIYSFGVVLYQMLTGRRPVDRPGHSSCRVLVEWVQKFRDRGWRKFYRIMDRRLHNHYSMSAALKVAELADRCVSHNPGDRPNIWEIITVLREAISESEKAGEESHSDLPIPSVHLPPTESRYDADAGASMSALKHTVPELEMAEIESSSDSNVGSLYTNPSQSQSPTSPGEIKPDSSEFRPMPNQYQPSDILSPDELYKDGSPYESFDDEKPASRFVANHPDTVPLDFDNNQGAHYNDQRLSKQRLELENDIERKRMLCLLPEEYEFEQVMLIQLWMALGLLPDEPMEEIGAIFFQELLSRGYILCSASNSLYKVDNKKLSAEWGSSRVMHNYIKLGNGSQNKDTSEHTLHASVICDDINASIFKTLGGFKRLRTLLFLGNYGSRLQKVPRDLFLSYESLEALDLSGTHIKELPSSAGKMINLRYLDLSWTFIETLPERIDRFQKLQTLKLEGCSRIRRLPKEMKGLTELRHLHLDVMRQLTAFPEGMRALVNIRTLYAFPVGIGEGLKISELKHLNNIMGSFCIAKIENVQTADEAKEASLAEKKNIKKLKLRWSNYLVQQPRNEDKAILENLRPHCSLEEIQILHYPGTTFPSWISDVSFYRLVNMTLFGCASLISLPSLEKLPLLASLELISLNSVTKVGFKGDIHNVAFPKLVKLAVDEMLNVQTWAKANEGDYPCLVELSIKDCPKLLEFPSLVYLNSLKSLEVRGCTNLAFVSEEALSTSLQEVIVEDCPIVEERCFEDGGQDWHKIQHVPKIWINQVAVFVHGDI